MNTRVRSNFFLFLAAIIWGFAFVAQVEVAGLIGDMSFNGVRCLLGAFSLIPVILIFEREKLSRLQWTPYIKYGLLCGTVLFLATNLQQRGIVLMDSAGRAGFLTGLYTVLVPIIGVVFLKKKSSLNIWLGAILAVLGLSLLCLPGSDSANGTSAQDQTLGIIITLIGAVFWALHILFIDRFAHDLSPIKFSASQFFVCGMLSMIGALIFEVESIPTLVEQVVTVKWPILYGGLMSVGIAYTCQVVGQRDANPTAAAIILSTESVFSALGEILFYCLIIRDPEFEMMSVVGWIGCLIMFAGIVASQVTFPKGLFRSKNKRIENPREDLTI